MRKKEMRLLLNEWWNQKTDAGRQRSIYLLLLVPASICLIYSYWQDWIAYSPILLAVMSLCFLTLHIAMLSIWSEKNMRIIMIAVIVLFLGAPFLENYITGKGISSYLSPIVPVIIMSWKKIPVLKKIIITTRQKKIMLFAFFLLTLAFVYYMLRISHFKFTHSFTFFFIALSLTILPLIQIIVIYEQEKIKEKEQLKQAQTQAKLSSLKDQLSPHFLFNTLNTITSISQEQTVKDFVDEVANIYRYVLQFKEVDSVTLRQEMEFIQSYLYIIKSRLEGGIDFEITIENENLLDSKMPPLTLQMLIENAVKHNSTSADKPLSIKLFTTEDSMLVVQNVYQPKLSVLPGNETGLKNIAERYRLLYKKEIVVENKNGFFTVKLPIVMAW